MRTLTQQPREHFRALYEAWDAQIQRLLPYIAEREKCSDALASLLARQGEVREAIRSWDGSPKELQHLDESWQNLRLSWESLLDGMEVVGK